MATYLPTVNLTPLYTFVQFSSTTSALQAALISAFPDVASIQVFADAANSGNALVVANDAQVLTVPVNSYVGYNLGSWAQYTAAKLATLFTAYTP